VKKQNKINEGDFVFIQTKNGYVDPAPYQVKVYSCLLVELYRRFDNSSKVMTPDEFNEKLQPTRVVVPTEEENAD
jgi:hypothetical protein